MSNPEHIPSNLPEWPDNWPETQRYDFVIYDTADGKNHVHLVDCTGELQSFFHQSALGAFAAKDAVASEFWLTEAFAECRDYGNKAENLPVLLNRNGVECYEDDDIHKVYGTQDYVWLDRICRNNPACLDIEPEAVEELGIMTQAEWYATPYDDRPYYDFVATQRELLWQDGTPRLQNVRSHVQIGVTHNGKYTPFVTVLDSEHPVMQIAEQSYPYIDPHW